MSIDRIIAVCGATATGKSALAVRLAQIYDGEIISCDSVQVYKGLDIGSAKVTKEEMCGVAHHLIDVCEPSGDFSCADYSVLAKKAVEDIRSRGKTVIFCGGTGLYLDSVIGISGFSDTGKDDAFRAEMEKKSPQELHRELASVDPESAFAIHPNNVKRVIRALEIFRVTGKTKTYWDELSKTEKPQYDAVVLVLDYRDRAMLYSRIDSRVDEMLEKGLLDEVKALDCAEFRASTAGCAIGYKEMFDYIDGKCTLGEAAERIKQASRNYAKRQITWFKRYKNAHRIYVDEFPEQDKFKLIVNSAVSIIDSI